MQFRHFLKSQLRRLGYDMHRYLPVSSPAAQMQTILSARNINLVLDVGANQGQFGLELRDLGYTGRIVSFEPLASAHALLLENARKDGAWQVAERMALGSGDGEIDIHVSGNSVSSSALPMLDSHLASAPGSAYVAVERVPLRRLDSVALSYFDAEPRVLLKIDTQGFEDRVLEGASGLIDKVDAVQLELSLTLLYSGQKLFVDMIQSMALLGFDLWAAWPVFVDPETGRCLQMDATFVRSAR